MKEEINLLKSEKHAFINHFFLKQKAYDSIAKQRNSFLLSAIIILPVSMIAGFFSIGAVGLSLGFLALPSIAFSGIKQRQLFSLIKGCGSGIKNFTLRHFYEMKYNGELEIMLREREKHGGTFDAPKDGDHPSSKNKKDKAENYKYASADTIRTEDDYHFQQDDESLDDVEHSEDPEYENKRLGEIERERSISAQRDDSDEFSK